MGGEHAVIFSNTGKGGFAWDETPGADPRHALVPRTAMITQALHAPGSFVLSSPRYRWRYCLNVLGHAGIGTGTETTPKKYDIATWPHG